MNTTKPVAIYLCLDEEGWPRYVGKTLNPRDRKAAHRRERGWFCCLLVLEWTTYHSYQQKERDWIAYFRQLGFPLENKNNGGGGVCFQSDVAKQHMSEIQLGRKQSEETKQKKSQKLKGRSRPAEESAKAAASLRGKKRSLEANEKSRIASIEQWKRQRAEGYSHSEQTKRKISQSVAENWNKRRQNVPR